MMKVLTQPVLKLKYFDCKKGAGHEGEVLNYVCIQKTCEDKGLICSVCKHDHSGHNVIPLKYLVGALRNHKQNPMQSQSFQAQLQRLQQLKNSFLYELKTMVEKLSQQVQKIQEQIIQQFKTRKVQLLNQVQQIEINMKFNEIIESTLSNNLGDQDSFEKDFKVIASLIESKDTKKQNNHTNNFSFSINLNKIILQYEHNYNSFSNKIHQLLKETQVKFTSLLEQTVEQKEEQKSKLKPQEKLNDSNEYKFNQKAKGSIIKLTNNLKTAECTSTGNERFALIDGPVNKKGSWIRFKVQKLKNWVGFGIAIRNNIVSKKFQFLYNSLGHGSFLLSNNSYSWSHAYAANNIQNSNFSFTQNQIIKVQINQNELIFTNQSQQNKQCKLPILLNQNQWKEVCFCVNLCSVGDAATIL